MQLLGSLGVDDEPSARIGPEEGRLLFGRDPTVYASGRPQYPEVLYTILERRCGLVAGASVLEIGPGTGLVTKRLLASEATVVGIEPNPNFANHLRSELPEDLEVIEATFETAELAGRQFDLAIAATSFHWINQESGLAKLGQLVRPGGSIALWWTLYQDPFVRDDFDAAMEDVLGVYVPALFAEPDRPPFQIDVEHRLRDLETWGGFEEVEAEIIKTPQRLNAKEFRALYASMAVVLRRSPTEQVVVLDAIERLAEAQPDGQLERVFVTALYTGSRPVNPSP